MEDIIPLNINEIAPNPMRPRSSFPQESLMRLSDSIRTHGVLQPILVAATPAGYQIISGERRWRAAKLAGLTQIPAVVKRGVNPQDMLMLSLVENVQIEPITVFEQAGVIQRLQNEFGMSLQEIGEIVGLSIPQLEKRLKLLELSDKVKNEILSRQLSDREALALVNSSDEKEAYKEVVNKPKHGF